MFKHYIKLIISSKSDIRQCHFNIANPLNRESILNLNLRLKSIKKWI